MAGGNDETQRVRAIWDRLAPRYARGSGLGRRLLGDGRAWAASHVHGDVLELAVGTGMNLPAYPIGTRLTGIDISPRMLEFATARAEQIGMVVDLRVGDAQRLEFEDGAFDTVICTLSLCSIPDDRQAIAEAFRVLRPGGRLVLVEHVRSTHRSVRAALRFMERWSVPNAGDHLLRDPLDHLGSLGFEVESAARSRLGVIERIVARRP